LPNKKNVKIILTSGASCPDSEVDKVLNKLLTFFEDANPIEEVLNDFSSK
jgi:4-hydroxy-3-methylbut-2-enyl diphosphate reductase